MENPSESDAIYGCGKCKYSTNHLAHLKGHVEFVHEKVGDLDNTPPILEDHVSEADGKEQKDFSCEKCSYIAKIASNLHRHVNAVHEGLRKFACLQCDQKFTSKQHAAEHMKRVHDNIKREKNLACQHCDYRTPYSWVLKKHLRRVHKEEMELKCKKCEYKTTKKTEIQDHLITTHNNTTEKCQNCNFETNHAHRLKDHVKEVHEKIRNEACPLCNFKSSRRSSVRKHMKTMHMDKVCGSSNIKTNMKRHPKDLELIQDATLNDHTLNADPEVEDDQNSMKGKEETLDESVNSKEATCYLCTHVAKDQAQLTSHIMNLHVVSKITG